MDGATTMQTYSARLASFHITYPLSKKRSSDAKGTKTMKWRHKNPGPAELAQAGFFYRPTPANPDNAKCFLCEYNLDGWEEDDDAIVEHLKHSPDCGWAIIINLEEQTDDENLELDDPLSETLLNAREMTFGSRWPHENKKGWICKTQKMIESGWYYSPMEEGDDFVRCSYCSLALDGWERKDNPFDEHQRRSPDCKFFSLIASTKPKAGRPRKSRTSKVSRKSTQSNSTFFSEDISMTEAEGIEDHNTILCADEIEEPAPTGRGRKKVAKAKKLTTKPRTKTAKTAKIETGAPSQASSFIEPEDDNFDVKVETISLENPKRKKRSSDDMNEDQDNQLLNIETPDFDSQHPPTKRRVTRSRSSVMHAENVSISSTQNDRENDASMNNVQKTAPLDMSVSKKGTKRGKKRASSTVRKASAKSTASIASLRVVPDDSAIDAALEADLDRPLTDDEYAAEQPELPQPKARRLTRTRPGSRNGPASIASVRRNTRRSSMAPRSINTDKHEKCLHISNEAAQIDPSRFEEKEVSLTKLREYGANDVASPSVSSMRENSAEHTTKDLIQVSIPLPTSDKQSLLVKSKALKSRKLSRHITERDAQASKVTSEDVLTYPELNDPKALSQVGKDESGHETDIGIISQGPIKQKEKKGPSGVKKGKLKKKPPPPGRDVENVVRPTIEKTGVGEIEDSSYSTMTDVTYHVEAASSDNRVMQETSEDANDVTESAIPCSPATTPVSLSSQQTSTNVEGGDIKAPALSAYPIEAVEESSKPLPSPPTQNITMKTPSPVQKPADSLVRLSDTQTTPPIVASPQSSDAENQPPSSRPSATRPPIVANSPLLTQTKRIPLTATTPTSSPSGRTVSRLQSSIPWTAIELEKIFLGSPVNKENNSFFGGAVSEVAGELDSPEKKLSVEEWVQFNAKKGEAKLRNECERLVGKFEGEGVRALRTLEGITCID